MPVQFPTSMASPTDSASKDPVNPDTTRSTADATTRAPTNPDTNSTPKEDVEPSSHSIKAQQLKDIVVGPVELSSTADSSRRSSAGSLRFDIPQRPGLPRGNSRAINGHRIRNASPPPTKFRRHVAFDTTNQDITKNSGITLSARHNGFHGQRRSKTFIVGVDEHKYSEAALEWLLTSMVDDHDTVVCVRVIEKDVKPHQNALYKEQTHQLLQNIIKKNKLDKAICIILEYQFGRLGPTFDTMVSVHQPSMLVVGTKGKSNQGMQGMWNTRHSFSKYCLEKSSVPVVVVRPQDVRLKKKDKRARDPNRSSYAQMLANTNGVHESDLMDDKMLLSSVTQLSSLDEASQVAKALCLPAEFDPTIKTFKARSRSQPSIFVDRALSGTPEDASQNALAPGKAASTANDSGPEGSDDGEGDDDDDGDDEEPATVSEQVSEQVKKERLHKMEVGEAAALKKRNTGDLLDD